MPKTIPLTEFDMITLPDYIQLIKAMLPFMEYNMQKNISMLIRAYELRNTIHFYNSPASCNIFKTCSNSSGISFNTPINEILGNEKLINTITTYCPGSIVNMINTYKNISKMSDMFNMMDLFNSSFSDNNNGSDGNNNSDNSNSSDSSNSSDNSNNSHCNPDNSLLNNIMNPCQKDMYNEYIRQLDALDFNFNEHK